MFVLAVIVGFIALVLGYRIFMIWRIEKAFQDPKNK